MLDYDDDYFLEEDKMYVNVQFIDYFRQFLLFV